MTTLYLVSACQEGLDYWKIGITHHEDPLKRNPENYREAFRAVAIEDKETAEFVEWTLKRHLKEIGCPIGTESIPITASLESVCALFDQHVAWHNAGLTAWADRYDEELGATWQELKHAVLADIALANLAKTAAHPEPMWA